MSMYGVAYAPLAPGNRPGAKQSMREECDVNKIVLRFQKTGLLTHVASGVPAFVDVSELGDYRSVIEQVRLVEEYFLGLPAKVRSAFENDARSFMDYLEGDPSQGDLEALGLEAIEGRLSSIEDRPPIEPELDPIANKVEPPGGEQTPDGVS